MWMTVKVSIKFILTYFKYFYYGLKQRVCALFNRELSILNFIKSLLKLPFEAWYLSKIDYNQGYF